MSDRVERDPNGSHTAPRPATVLPLDRFNAFSDGVFAIAITPQVLAIGVPSPSAPLGPALRKLSPDFLGYLISFAYVGGIWIAHTGFHRLMMRGDSTAYGLNLLMLLFVGLLPFTTKSMVTHLSGQERLPSILSLRCSFWSCRCLACTGLGAARDDSSGGWVLSAGWPTGTG